MSKTIIEKYKEWYNDLEKRLESANINWSIIREILEKKWCPETAYRKKDYSPELPSRGQCYVTSLLINHLFGGEIINGKVKYNGESHYWNIVNGKGVDLTSDQYGGDGIHPLPDRSFSKIRTVGNPNFNNKRFLILKELWYA
jgi:hypothetical protein